MLSRTSRSVLRCQGSSAASGLDETRTPQPRVSPQGLPAHLSCHFRVPSPQPSSELSPSLQLPEAVLECPWDCQGMAMGKVWGHKGSTAQHSSVLECPWDCQALGWFGDTAEGRALCWNVPGILCPTEPVCFGWVSPQIPPFWSGGDVDQGWELLWCVGSLLAELNIPAPGEQQTPEQVLQHSSSPQSTAHFPHAPPFPRAVRCSQDSPGH